MPPIELDLPVPKPEIDEWGGMLNAAILVLLQAVNDGLADLTVADGHFFAVHQDGTQTDLGPLPVGPPGGVNEVAGLQGEPTAQQLVDAIATPLSAQTAQNLTDPGAVRDAADARADNRIAAAVGSTVASVRATPRGNLFVIEGESHMARPAGGQVSGPGIGHWASIESGQRIRIASRVSGGQVVYGYSAVNGSTMQQLIDRFSANVAAFAPTDVLIGVGTNNAKASSPITPAAFKAQLLQYLALCRKIGARLHLMTIYPNVDSTAIHQKVVAYNAVYREVAAAEGLNLIDSYALLVDPATGGIKSTYSVSGDTTHINNAGNRAVAQLVVASVAGHLPPVTPLLPQSNVDPYNLLPNGLFLTDNGGTTALGGTILPTGYSRTPSTRGAQVSAEFIAGSGDVLGRWYRTTLSASSAGEILYRNVTGYVPGNRYAFVGRLLTSGLRGTDTGDGAVFTSTARFNNQSGIAGYDFREMSQVPYDVNGVFRQEFIAPADASALQVQPISLGVVTAGSGYAQIAQHALYDLTAMGLA